MSAASRGVPVTAIVERMVPFSDRRCSEVCGLNDSIIQGRPYLGRQHHRCLDDRGHLGTCVFPERGGRMR